MNGTGLVDPSDLSNLLNEEKDDDDIESAASFFFCSCTFYVFYLFYT